MGLLPDDLDELFKMAEDAKVIKFASKENVKETDQIKLAVDKTVDLDNKLRVKGL